MSLTSNAIRAGAAQTSPSERILDEADAAAWAELARLLLEGVRRARRQREPALTRRRRREDDPAEVG